MQDEISWLFAVAVIVAAVLVFGGIAYLKSTDTTECVKSHTEYAPVFQNFGLSVPIMMMYPVEVCDERR